MDRAELYNKIAERKIKPKDFEPYTGGNGRVDRCFKLFKEGKLRTGRVLVDVGGGIGDLGYLCKDIFEKRYVVDISDENIKAALAKGNDIDVCDVDKYGLTFVNDEVDVITALDFIEHIIDPEHFARECFRVLKHKGQVCINTPNIQFFEHIRALAQDGRFPHTSGDKEVYHGGHLAFYTYLDICDIFGKAGFVGFEQIKDEENYKQPTQFWIDILRPRNQKEYVDACMRLGNSNLIIICEKP